MIKVLIVITGEDGYLTKNTGKNKKPIYSLKKIKKSDKDIIRVDQYTFYVKSCDPNKEPYFVYKEHVNRDQWLCDCMSFVMSLTDNGHAPECKHILKCKEFTSIV